MFLAVTIFIIPEKTIYSTEEQAMPPNKTASEIYKISVHRNSSLFAHPFKY